MRDRGVLCAALLASARPVSAQEVAALLDIDGAEVPAVVDELRRVLKRESLGLIVEEVAGGYRLVVDPDLHNDLADLLSPAPLPPLSNAALETLALVAYRQPVTRGELEASRGASCASTLETLQERELIKVVGRKDVVGRPLLYGTTDRFLLEFGLNSLDDLPGLEQESAAFVRG